MKRLSSARPPGVAPWPGPYVPVRRLCGTDWRFGRCCICGQSPRPTIAWDLDLNGRLCPDCIVPSAGAERALRSIGCVPPPPFFQR